VPTDVISSTKRFVCLLWACRAGRCASYLSETFSFVGPFDNMTGSGMPEFFQCCRRAGSIARPLSFNIDTAQVVHEDVDTSVVLVIGGISPAGGRSIAHGRCTFVWHRDTSGFKLVHLHVSIPTLQRTGMDVRSLVLPSSETGTAAYDKPTFVRDVRGTTRMIDSNQTTYLEASHQYVIVHLRDDSFKVRCSLTNLISQLPSCFVCVHRSYVVNALLVTGMKGPLITLVDGDTVSVPSKRVREVRDILQQVVTGPVDTTGTGYGKAPDRQD